MARACLILLRFKYVSRLCKFCRWQQVRAANPHAQAMRSCFFFSSPARSVTAIAGALRVWSGFFWASRLDVAWLWQLQGGWDGAVAMERRQPWNQQPAAGNQLEGP